MLDAPLARRANSASQFWKWLSSLIPDFRLENIDASADRVRRGLRVGERLPDAPDRIDHRRNDHASRRRRAPHPRVFFGTQSGSLFVASVLTSCRS